MTQKPDNGNHAAGLTSTMECPDCGRDYSGPTIYGDLRPGADCPADDCPPNESTEYSPWCGDVLYRTPIWRIGKHEWRMVVYVEPRYGNCTSFEWRKAAHKFCGYDWPATRWAQDVDWPRYDGNHCDGGMPKTLRKLYEAHKTEIKAALNLAA